MAPTAQNNHFNVKPVGAFGFGTGLSISNVASGVRADSSPDV